MPGGKQTVDSIGGHSRAREAVRSRSSRRERDRVGCADLSAGTKGVAAMAPHPNKQLAATSHKRHIGSDTVTDENALHRHGMTRRLTASHARRPSAGALSAPPRGALPRGRSAARQHGGGGRSSRSISEDDRGAAAQRLRSAKEPLSLPQASADREPGGSMTSEGRSASGLQATLLRHCVGPQLAAQGPARTAA